MRYQILANCSVMPTAYWAVVIADSIQIVANAACSISAFILLLIGQILAKSAHFKVFNRKINLFLDFTTLCIGVWAAEIAAKMGESLEMDDQILWEPLDLYLLEGWHIFVTLGAKPFIGAREYLFLAEAVQAFVNRRVLSLQWLIGKYFLIGHSQW